jgi:hypothetical protein
VARDYGGVGMNDLVRRVAEYKAGQEVEPVPTAPLPGVDLVSVAAHGEPDTMIVRAEVHVNGETQAERHTVRYLILPRKFLGGGRMVTRETHSYRYYQALF